MKPTQTVDAAWAGARPAHHEGLRPIDVDRARPRFATYFIFNRDGPAQGSFEKKVVVCLSIYRRERIYNYRLIWDRWFHGVKYLRSQEFVAKVIVKARHDAINRWYRVLEMSCDLACQRHVLDYGINI